MRVKGSKKGDPISDEEIDSDEAYEKPIKKMPVKNLRKKDEQDDDVEIVQFSDLEEEEDTLKQKSKKKSEMPLNEDELELIRLEKKLGISKKDKDSWKKLEKGLLDDGFDPEMIEFLQSGEQILAKEAKMEKMRKRPSSEEDDDDEDMNEEDEDSEVDEREEDEQEEAEPAKKRDGGYGESRYKQQTEEDDNEEEPSDDEEISDRKM